MQIDTIRRHMRIMKRVSGAVENPNEPSYMYSALWYFERNEELWGRKAPQVNLQESVRYFDSFQAALPDQEDLRSAAEALHVLMLRGHVPKFTQRTVTEQAKALATYNRVPRLLLPRFPEYKQHLAEFQNIRKFHETFTVGLAMDGNPVDSHLHPRDFPMFAQESLDKLINIILVPIMTHKKHSSLTTTGSCLGIGFIKEALPEIDQLYQLEVTAKASTAAVGQVAHEGTSAANTEDSVVSESEGVLLEKEWAKREEGILTEMAGEVLRKSVVILRHDERDLLTKLANQPCMSDGAARMWMWNAGCQATKDPARHISPYRMKASMDETSLHWCFDAMTKTMADADVGLFLAGRNRNIYGEILREVRTTKPRLRMLERTLEPDEDRRTRN